MGWGGNPISGHVPNGKGREKKKKNLLRFTVSMLIPFIFGISIGGRNNLGMERNMG